MDEFIGNYQFWIAWAVYVLAGLVFCAFWWRVSSIITHGGWRDLLRGLALVVIYTPWYVGDAHEYLAPAIVVVLMDILLGSSDNGLAGTLVLLMSLAAMLVILIGRRVLSRKSIPEQST